MRHDVERIRPTAVLAATALNLTGRSIGDDAALPLEDRIAASGEPTRTVTDLGAHELGRVFRLGDSSHTVVRPDRTVIDHGIGFRRYEVHRYLIAAVGPVGIASVVGYLLTRIGDRDHSWPGSARPKATDDRSRSAARAGALEFDGQLAALQALVRVDVEGIGEQAQS